MIVRGWKLTDVEYEYRITDFIAKIFKSHFLASKMRIGPINRKNVLLLSNLIFKGFQIQFIPLKYVTFYNRKAVKRK